MTKQHILDEIKRVAELNGGTPLGIHRFFQQTGIKCADWYGKYWARWGDAIQEAGLTPNKLQARTSEELLIEKYVLLIRELGRIPVTGELRLRRRQDASFPNDKTLNRWGTKTGLIMRAADYCRRHGHFDDVLQLCAEILRSHPSEPERQSQMATAIGFVYLMKSGRYFKVGRTNALGRREYELAIQLPEKAQTVHKIKTDDPTGIEGYWHNRFASKRVNGEWFALDAADVQAFRRRKFM